MEDNDYKKWADYVEKLFEINGSNPHMVLDLGCGTGSFCIEMAKRGHEMIGIDLSLDMLSCANEKSTRQGTDILFLNQDMTDFELYGTVDAVVCLMDSINYVTYKRDVLKILKLVKNYLNPEGLFIFDINSYYKFDKILDNNVFYNIDDEVTYIWQNSFDKSKSICRFDLTFFVKDGLLYNRFDEVHYERAYKTVEIKDMIKRSGLELCGIYGEFDTKNPTKRCERTFFVCKNEQF